MGVKLEIRPQQQPIATSQIAQDVLGQTNDPPGCSQKCQASLQQIQSLLRQKGQRFKAQGNRICVRFTAESGSSRQ